MQRPIKNIWIESEDKGAIIGGTEEINDNSDVIVTFDDKSKYVATFFTYDNIEYLRQKNRQTGECLDGRFFWASDMIIIERINRKEVVEIIEHLIKEKEFESIFDQITE
ncbi:hypothetical protein FORMB_12120 [Formosa sp. Hel1_33_131]|uniref:hypothetical protein n=1 Tax=Formosa sp. Hel1_33_131 TaxID=1336794 RepID=UPI00084E153A|nr:hypothetical protein [Formosa sp. Hel1_33_131]AOR28257.1 hypothetical protein FORMB_12120 [Formosa sp. Hel1_33_131]